MSNRIRTEPITTSDEDSSLSSVQDGRGTAFAYRCHMEGLQGYALRVVKIVYHIFSGGDDQK
jgi:hypothetical protein